MSKHTKGKWEIKYFKGDFDVVQSVGIRDKVEGGDYWEIVCDVLHGAKNDKDYLKNWKEQIEANANLIAKSPEMFEYIQKKADNGCEEAKEIIKQAAP